MTDELALKLMNRAEELIGEKENQERLLATLEEAERILPEDASLICRSARVLFRYGILNSKGHFFLLALDKLKLAKEKSPLFFDSNSTWWQLWGNTLVQLGKLLNDSSFFEEAIKKYEKASKVSDEINPEIYWDSAEAWLLLGQKSGEVADFQKALSKFYFAREKGISSHFFRLDFGNALVLYGRLMGNPSFVDEAISLYKEVITDTYNPQEELSVAYMAAWRKLAHAIKVRYQLTHCKEHFEEADNILRDAILATKNGELWLDWGELYLHAGWIKRDIKLIEVGLEKLTSSKIKDCDPLRVSFLLGIGLVTFGIFLENLKMIKDGQERLQLAFETYHLVKNQGIDDIDSHHFILPHHSQLIFASGFAQLGIGLYFSDETAFARAAGIFEKGLQEDAASTENWHSLFHTYLAWGLDKGDPTLVQKGIKAIARLCELRPFSPIHLNEWGVALLRMKQLRINREMAEAYIDEAIHHFSKALALCEDDETLYNLGCAYDLLGDVTADEEDYAKAIDLLTKVHEKKPSEFHVRYHLGIALSHLGELTLNADCFMQSAELLESIAKIDLENEYVWCDLGYALLNLSELVLDPLHPDEGEKMRREAEKALLHGAELGSGDAYYHLACLYSLTGFYEASIQYLKRAASVGFLPANEDLEHDEWLDGLRETEAFQDFLKSQGEDG